MRAGLLIFCLAGPAVASGMLSPAPQEGSPFRAVVPLRDGDDQVKIVRSQRPPKVVQVVWRGIEVPITDPVQDCEVATTADGSGLVILAGGIRESLDLYLVDLGSRAMIRFQTNGGRRLPASFNGGSGSWPVTEGLNLVLFMFEQDGRLRFRALDVAGGAHADRADLPRAVRGFEARPVPGRGAVQVRFAAGIPDLEFSHPAAPRLDIDTARLVFDRVTPGGSVLRETVVRNVGGRTLELVAKLGDGPFRLRQAPPSSLEAGGDARVVVEFAPERVGSWQARLEFAATGAVADAVVMLTGEAVAAVPAPPIAVPLAVRVPRANRPPPVTAVVERAVHPAPALAPTPISPLARPRGDGRVELRAQVTPRAANSRSLRFLVQNLTTGELLPPIVADGELKARRVRAAAGDELAIATQVGDLVSEWAMVAPVAPSLSVPAAPDGARSISVHACRDAPFLLCAVAAVDHPGSQDRVALRALRTWRGATDANGHAELPLQALGDLPRPFELLLVVEGPRGVMRSEPVRVD